MGLLVIDYDDAGTICGLAIGKTSGPSDAAPAIRKEETAKPVAAPKAEPPLRSVADENQEQLRQLYFVAEQYMANHCPARRFRKLTISLIHYIFQQI